jgi:hypothetical protein
VLSGLCFPLAVSLVTLPGKIWIRESFTGFNSEALELVIAGKRCQKIAL